MRSGSKEHIYHTMESPHKKSLGRNCVSLENLGVFVTEDAFAGGNGVNGAAAAFPPSYPHMQPMYPCFYYNSPFPPLQQQPHPFYMGYNSYLAHQNSAYFNSSSIGNSKQSLDDYRKYRDVALWEKSEKAHELQLGALGFCGRAARRRPRSATCTTPGWRNWHANQTLCILIEIYLIYRYILFLLNRAGIFFVCNELPNNLYWNFNYYFREWKREIKSNKTIRVN